MNEELFRRMLELAKGQEQDYSTWIQCGKLSQDDRRKYRSHERLAMNKGQEVKALMAKIEAIQADMKAVGAGWWAHLHQTYSLPHGNDWYITSDGRILKKPKRTE